jgi:hypothetical protein
VGGVERVKDGLRAQRVPMLDDGDASHSAHLHQPIYMKSVFEKNFHKRESTYA